MCIRDSSEGGAGNITPWRPVKHFDYNFLRNAIRKVLLKRLTSRIGPAFRKVKNEMYTKHADGFYVRAKPNLCTPISPLNTSADTSADLLLPHRVLILMTAKM